MQNDKKASEGVGEIKKFAEISPSHKLQEDPDEISSTDDVQFHEMNDL